MLLAGLTVSFAGEDINNVVLQQIKLVPTGGGYSTTSGANHALVSAVSIHDGTASINPAKAQPSYCSGATYLVFLMTLAELERTHQVTLDDATWAALRPESCPDGTGIWGRWNANGPGTARLFFQLGLGPNFTNFAQARPGDFMKIFWHPEIGAREHGHSVIFLGTEQKEGVEYVRFWSSNIPGGFGEKSVPRSKISFALFSRLEKPQQITTWKSMTPRDSYLASLLTSASSLSELKRLCGVKD